ncbi:hypothetical protein BDV93DRAFT_505910 [Ceratobasidium sp. AG-I]|nr:hypothetical protein BDV93DRAFT_505910 [Ceratobasidium sp. AG-I]
MFFGFFSLCLLVLDLLTMRSIWPDLALGGMWLVNAKDAMVGRIPANGSQKSTWKGHIRSPPRSRVYGVTLSVCLIGLLFRRVSPAETKSYAFVRNIFAVLSMAAIVWRAVTAFSQAQNEFETRVAFDVCPSIIDRSSLYVMVATPLEVLTSSSTGITTYDYSQARPNVTMSAARSAAQEDNCLFLDGPSTSGYVVENWFTVFGCPSNSALRRGGTRFNIHVQYYSNRSLETSRFWLSGNTGSSRNLPYGREESSSLQFNSAVQLEPGFHLNAEVGFITRRLIISSVLHDVILQRKTKYEQISIYPLNTIGIVPLNDSTIATASISVSFRPKQAILRDQHETFDPVDYCDYIEDYRTKTVFDVIGSIGGLFALLQSMHILLFGRPMLWGLTGAKLITPFGLLGSCSSARFKRRLQEGYHRQDPVSDRRSEDAAETIRIGAFLRDFVIDFGPADIPSVPSLAVTEPESPRSGVPAGSEQREILLSTLHDGRLSSESGPLEVERNTSTSEYSSRGV